MTANGLGVSFGGDERFQKQMVVVGDNSEYTKSH